MSFYFAVTDEIKLIQIVSPHMVWFDIQRWYGFFLSETLKIVSFVGRAQRMATVVDEETYNKEYRRLRTLTSQTDIRQVSVSATP